ncbi:MAG: hypothetical protein Ct9H90mP13_12430 [Pseudomonadota bacterium]|nr:MAG: hypothetical protein Ct9H90mP13_12430 [Pseudomonadota bacterium]
MGKHINGWVFNMDQYLIRAIDGREELKQKNGMVL